MTKWRYIKEDKVSADYGLATDEFLMNGYSDSNKENASLRLYTYKDYCTLVGRFQNIHAELDLDNIKKTGYQFSRRLTGGGAIIMGQGQLGLCLATANTFHSENTRALYHLFSAPVLAALKEFGIEAKFRGKNDLEVAGKKIAGLGIHVNPFGAIQFHTSLLVDLDIEIMLNVLNIPLQKIGDKAQVHKVEQRITTISKELNRKVTVEEVREVVKFYFEKHFKIKLQEEALTKEEQNEIEKLAKEKYRNEDWLFQNSPQPDMTGMGLKKTPAGLLRTYVALKGEIIKSVLITGDFIEQEKLFKYIEAQLKWSALDKEQILKVIQKAFTKFSKSTVGLSERAVLHSIWTAAMAAMKEVQYTYEGSCYYPNP
ncbi:MAG TPA: lipoate--protein ligase family protein [Saprospiraceae bacterium]|nr:lipoate--protein ligase family protein [Saprospiraceae bacterium]